MTILEPLVSPEVRCAWCGLPKKDHQNDTRKTCQAMLHDPAGSRE